MHVISIKRNWSEKCCYTTPSITLRSHIDQKTGECQVHQIERGNQTEIIKVLKKIIKKYLGKQVCMIWDNAKWHNGAILRRELAKQKQLKDLYLIRLPPYAPDHDPIEHVRQTAKSQIANKHSISFKQTKQ